MSEKKLWGGRFTKSTDSFTDHFHSSISFDSRMYKEDILGSCAHAAMLGKQNIIPKEDSDLIIKTLKEILADIEALGKSQLTLKSFVAARRNNERALAAEETVYRRYRTFRKTHPDRAKLLANALWQGRICNN